MVCLVPVQFEFGEAAKSSCAESVKTGHIELQPHFCLHIWLILPFFQGDDCLFYSETISSLH